MEKRFAGQLLGGRRLGGETVWRIEGETRGVVGLVVILRNLGWWGEFDETILTRPENAGQMLDSNSSQDEGQFWCLDLEAMAGKD